MCTFSIKIQYLNSIIYSEDWLPFLAIEFSVGSVENRGAIVYEPAPEGHKAMVF
jgi:hypothetical protein